MSVPSRYGVGMGPYRPIPGQPIGLSLKDPGINVSKAATDIAEGESPNASDVLLHRGGVTSEHGVTLLDSAYSGGANKTIINIAEFRRWNLSTVLVRMRPTEWDRWNGATWLTLGGTLSGIPGDRIYHLVMQDMLIAANKVDKLKKWTGEDVDSVVDLSADAPVAHYIAPMGQRIVAARINPGSGFDPYLVRWSADGILDDWTTANLGAGSAVLEPEGKTGSPQFITGLSALETALVIYRDRSIMLGTRTGVGANPFRFTTVLFGLGTEAPYSISNGGATLGDFFLGSDYNVYLFNGHAQPIPVGEPIYEFLRSQVNNPELSVGIVDRRNEEFHLLVCTGGSTIPNVDWIFNIGEYILTGRLSWRRRGLGDGYVTASFAATVGAANPVVDSVSDIVDTVGIRVDEFGHQPAPQVIMFGDNNGGVWYVDEETFIPGNYETRVMGDSYQENMLDRVFIDYTARTQGQIELSISFDGGLTWQLPKVVTLPITNVVRVATTDFNIVANLFQYRIRILSGDVTISRIRTHATPRGHAATS